ncbi:MAG: hypothetical protein IJV82_04925 [Oscillospiraceae bacterium]|nr:hypothetical protein [Oscillospiraceae bacterium]
MEQNQLDPIENNDIPFNQNCLDSQARLVVESPYPIDQEDDVADYSKPPEDTPKKAPKRKRKLLPIILASIAGLLVLAIVIGLCTNWYGFYGPGAKILSAGKETIAAGSFTVDIFFQVGKSTREYTMQVVFDPDARVLSVLCQEDDGNLGFAIYNGFFINSKKKKTDIREPLDKLFDMFSSGDGSKKSWEERLKDINEELYEQVRDKIDFDKINRCLVRFYRKLNSNQWLEKNAGYSMEKRNNITMYRFEPDTYELLDASLECFRDIFQDEEDFESIQDSLREEKENLNSVDYQISFGIQEDLMTHIGLEIRNTKLITFNLNISDIGSTGIDTDTLAKLLEKAR